MNKNTNYSKEDKIRLKKIIKSLDKDIKRLKIRRKNYKKQLTLTDVVKSFYCWDYDIGKKKCEEMCEPCSQCKSNRLK